MGDLKLEDLVGSIDSLPTLPSVVTKVSELVDNPSASAGDINEVISHDLALSSKILKLVNSAYYGFPRRISSITHAVVILGFQTIRNIALSAFVFDAFESGDLPFGYRNFWIHSVGVAAAANVIGSRQGVPLSEDPFMCGLLHDVGKLVLHQHLKKEFLKVLQTVESDKIPIFEAERRVLGTDHAEVGGLLMEHWKLPEKMVWALSFHHSPEKMAEADRKLAATVHAADVLARSMLIGCSGDYLVPEMSLEAWETLNLSADDLPEILQAISTDMAKVGAFIELVQGASRAQ